MFISDNFLIKPLPFKPGTIEAELYYLKEDYALGKIDIETLEYEIEYSLKGGNQPPVSRFRSEPTYREF